MYTLSVDNVLIGFVVEPGDTFGLRSFTYAIVKNN